MKNQKQTECTWILTAFVFSSFKRVILQFCYTVLQCVPENVGYLENTDNITNYLENTDNTDTDNMTRLTLTVALTLTLTIISHRIVTL